MNGGYLDDHFKPSVFNQRHSYIFVAGATGSRNTMFVRQFVQIVKHMYPNLTKYECHVVGPESVKQKQVAQKQHQSEAHNLSCSSLKKIPKTFHRSWPWPNKCSPRKQLYEIVRVCLRQTPWIFTDRHEAGYPSHIESKMQHFLMRKSGCVLGCRER